MDFLLLLIVMSMLSGLKEVDMEEIWVIKNLNIYRDYFLIKFYL